MICVVGVGNPLCSDDAVGPYIVSKIEAMKLPEVVTFMTQQLNLELLEEFMEFDRIIIVDASVAGKEVDFYSLKETPASRNLASSHHMSAQLFLLLARKVYNKDLDMYVCSVKGESFHLSEQISPAVLENAQKAIDHIVSFIGSHTHA